MSGGKMARKTLGFVNLIWTCAFCNTQNPGPIKSCTSCGAPQPADVKFEEVDQEKFDFIKDEALIRMAKAGPDKHCPYCGTRNLADAARCVQCGSDITVGAQARQQGQKVGAPETPAATPKKLSKGCLIALIIGAVIGCIISVVILINLLKKESAQGTVSQVAWQRALVIEAYTQVQGQAWYDEIPAGAELGSCSMRYRNTSSEPVVNATEVCGEPYTIDTGTGVGQVVQDCTYEVYADYCSYSGYAWTVIDDVTASGYDLSPYWPDPSLTSSQRIAEQKESYVIYFDVDGQRYPYTTSDLDLFQNATIGSTWQLEINGSGNVTSVSP
jgi:hypothetical protein